MDIVAQVAVLIGVVCNVIMGVSQCSRNFIIGTLSLLLSLAFQRSNRRLSTSHENIIQQLPPTMEAALNKFGLMSKTVTYAVCSCHCTYAPSYLKGSTVPSYPEYCTHHPNPETFCGGPLLDTQASGASLPKKTFIYHDFNDYLVGLLSRSDIKMMMDTVCDNLTTSLSSSPRFIKTPFEAQFL